VENHWKSFHHGTISQVLTWESKENHFFLDANVLYSTQIKTIPFAM